MINGHIYFGFNLRYISYFYLNCDGKVLLLILEARVKKDDTLFDDTSVDTFDNTFGDTFNDLASFNYPLRTLLIASGCC